MKRLFSLSSSSLGYMDVMIPNNGFGVSKGKFYSKIMKKLTIALL